MKHRFEQISIEEPRHTEALDQVADWSAESLSMKFYTVGELEQHLLGVAAFGENENFLGYVAVTEVSSLDHNKSARIGAFTVAESVRGNGVGRDLIKHLLDIVPESLPGIDNFYAFVHNGSLKPFLDNGAVIVGTRTPPAETGCNTIINIDSFKGLE
jgi:ribosomal protein S18 acetylase RimI-like enzyme